MLQHHMNIWVNHMETAAENDHFSVIWTQAVYFSKFFLESTCIILMFKCKEAQSN